MAPPFVDEIKGIAWREILEWLRDVLSFSFVDYWYISWSIIAAIAGLTYFNKRKRS